MEELTIEEKAKAYDEALKWMRDLYPNMGIAAKEKAESIFHELCESEDERIKKLLVEAVTQVLQDQYCSNRGVSKEKVVAWLEKQETSYTKKDVDDAYVEGMVFAKNKLEKQGEQKSAWSEEDDWMKTEIIKVLLGCETFLTPEETNECIYWLKSIKDRVYPKHEWKQENTDDLTDFENAMMHIGESFFGNNAGLDPNDTNAIKEQANTLLGLVPSKEWSEEDDDELLSITTHFDVKEVDLDSDIRTYLTNHFNIYEDGVLQSKKSGLPLSTYDIIKVAEHFFELGMAVNNKAQKGE